MARAPGLSNFILDILNSFKYRLLLRSDNADQRLTEKGVKAGVVNRDREIFWNEKNTNLLKANHILDSLDAKPNELKKYNGYPFSAEWLSAAFDYNQAPYFQSFMEIKVERSSNRIRLILYGIHGQLQWSDLEYGGMGKPATASSDDLVQWILPMNIP